MSEIHIVEFDYCVQLLFALWRNTGCANQYLLNSLCGKVKIVMKINCMYVITSIKRIRTKGREKVGSQVDESIWLEGSFMILDLYDTGEIC